MPGTWMRGRVRPRGTGGSEPAAYAVIDAARQAQSKGMQCYLIFMAVRLLEMQRILKPTGSLYLHCDDAAGAYLKLLMDAVSGRKQCRGRVIWKRQSGNNAKKGYGRIDGRRYKGDDLTSPNGSPSRWFTWRGATSKGSRGWSYSLERLEELWAAGLIHTRKDGVPSLRGHKKYLDEHPGSKVQNIWTGVFPVGNTARQRTHYPTQKPLALLDPSIKASSNPGDMALDPFCGCAAALAAADRLGRH